VPSYQSDETLTEIIMLWAQVGSTGRVCVLCLNGVFSVGA